MFHTALLLILLVFLTIYILNDWNLLAPKVLSQRRVGRLGGIDVSIRFQQLRTTNSTVSVALAALVAGVAVFLMPAAPKAEAGVTVSHLTKADRLPVQAKQVPCTLTSWPNYDPSCQFDLRAPSGDIRTVRIIALR